MNEEPYSQKEAEAATGLRTDNGSRKDASSANEAHDGVVDIELGDS